MVDDDGELVPWLRSGVGEMKIICGTAGTTSDSLRPLVASADFSKVGSLSALCITLGLGLSSMMVPYRLLLVGRCTGSSIIAGGPLLAGTLPSSTEVIDILCTDLLWPVSLVRLVMEGLRLNLLLVMLSRLAVTTRPFSFSVCVLLLKL